MGRLGEASLPFDGEGRHSAAARRMADRLVELINLG